MAKSVLIDEFSQNAEGATTARVEISTADGNLNIDGILSGEQVLASGTLQYLESQGEPSRSTVVDQSRASFILKSGEARHSWFRFPWAGCNGATDWQVHLNPKLPMSITARSGGGSIKLDLAGMTIADVSADTGGGNVDVSLPENATGLRVTARAGAGNVSVQIGNGTRGSHMVDAESGAGNMTVRVPSGVAARIHTTTGLGRVTVDTRFNRTDQNTYQSLGYDAASNKVEITASSGAGNVSVFTK